LIEYLIKGIILGISISVPLGPIAIVIVQRTINKGYGSGLVSGMGATFADTFYAAVAGFGISYIANFMHNQELLLRIVGGVFLIGLGAKIFLTNPIYQMKKYRLRGKNLIGDFLSVFFLTVSNPLTVAFFTATFAGLGLAEDFTSVPLGTESLIGGVFIGTLIWWLSLTAIINKYRHKFRIRKLFLINRISGLIIVVLGIAATVSILFFK